MCHNLNKGHIENKILVKERLNLPKASDKIWEKFDEQAKGELSNILNKQWENLPVAEMSQKLNDVMYEFLQDRVGKKEKVIFAEKKKIINNPLKKLRKAKKESKKQWKKAKNNPTVEPETVKNLLKWRNQLMRLHNQMRKLGNCR